MTDPEPPCDPFMEAVGRVVVNAAQLENALTVLLMALVGGHAEVVLKGLPIATTLDNLATAAKEIPAPISAEDLQSLVTRAKPLIKTRDQVVHSVWDFRPGALDKTSIRVRIRNQPTIERFTDARLHKLADDLGSCTDTALGYFWAMGESRP
jgi:hypothetical protein